MTATASVSKLMNSRPDMIFLLLDKPTIGGKWGGKKAAGGHFGARGGGAVRGLGLRPRPGRLHRVCGGGPRAPRRGAQDRA